MDHGQRLWAFAFTLVLTIVFVLDSPAMYWFEASPKIPYPHPFTVEAALCSPAAGFLYCIALTQHASQNGSSDSSSFPVGVIGTANGTGTGAFASTNVDLRTVANGGKIQSTIPVGGLLSGLYKSGGSITGTVGQTCTLASFNGGSSGATATVALTGTNTIASNTALVFTNAGTSTTTDPTTATLGSGTATCSGTATVDVLFATFVTPADIAFTSDSAGTTSITAWEIASYTATSGQFEAYVNLNISHTSDTLFYMSYGKASVLASAGVITSAWNSAFVFVTHMSSVATSGGHVTQLLDSTLNDNYPAGSSTFNFTAGGGVAGDAITATTNSSNLLVTTTNNFPVGASTRTLEFWLNMNNVKFPNGVNGVMGWGTGNVTDKLWGWYASDNTYSTRNLALPQTFSDDGVPSTDTPQTANWLYFVSGYPTGQTQVQQAVAYLNASALSLTWTHPTNTLNTGSNAQGEFDVGCNVSSTCLGTGKFDEVRVSNVLRSADWITATYNNLNTPGSFVTSSNTVAGGNMPPVIF